MNIADGRTIHIFNNRGRDDTEHLANAVASRLVTSLFCLDGRLHWLSEDGRLTAMSRRLLAELISRNFVTVRLAGADGSHFAEFLPLVIEGQALADVMETLTPRVGRGVSKPKALSDHQKQEIKQRARVGESRESIAQYYDTNIATVQAVLAA
jgi:hypothetical protein